LLHWRKRSYSQRKVREENETQTPTPTTYVHSPKTDLESDVGRGRKQGFLFNEEKEGKKNEAPLTKKGENDRPPSNRRKKKCQHGLNQKGKQPAEKKDVHARQRKRTAQALRSEKAGIRRKKRKAVHGHERNDRRRQRKVPF